MTSRLLTRSFPVRPQKRQLSLPPRPVLIRVLVRLTGTYDGMLR